MSNNPNIHIATPVIKPEDLTENTARFLAKDSFPLWALANGFSVDGSPFNFDNFKYMFPIYADPSHEIILAKGAQTGATIYQILKLLYHAATNPASKSALYLPTDSLVISMMKDRFIPIIQSSPAIGPTFDTNSSLALLQFGNKSSIYAFSVAGKSAKDSLPISGLICVDETRLIPDAAIPQIRERQSAQMIKRFVTMSTVGLPGQNIDRFYNAGTQHVWQARCGCKDGCDLPRTWPDCVADDPKRGVYYRCPKCLWRINDTQNGRFVPHNPGAPYNSYHVSQLNSRFMSLKEIWQSYKTTTNIAEWWNAKAGLPYINSDARGVTHDQLMACVSTEERWTKKKLGNGCAMGVDQGAGYVMVVIADISPSNGKKRIRHIEIIENTNHDYMENGQRVTPFKRLRELMVEFDVRLALCDGLPNFNDALQFAQSHPSRVFLAYYMRDAKHVVQWSDKKKGLESIRKAGSLLRFKYNALLNRYTSLETMLSTWSNGDVICPDPNGLVQTCMDEGTKAMMPEAVCRRLFTHLTRLIRNYKESNPETGEGRYEWLYTQGDPHLAHACNYCFIALERMKRTAGFSFL